jgi:8-amino-7-oxononanoate synthase
MYQGLKLSNKHKLKRYQNCNLNQLEDILKKHQNQNKLVFTESVFSMDGTVLNIEDFIFLKRKYGFFAYIDEAHSVGLFRENGYGLSYKYRDEIEVIMATFSKAIASQGGFLLTNKELQSNIINKANGLIYSTGLSPSNIGAALKAFEILPSLDFEREKISKITLELNSNSQIIPIVCSNEESLTNAYNFLLEKNILTSIIRHPTVPINKQRIRICINSEVDQKTVRIIKDALENFSI